MSSPARQPPSSPPMDYDLTSEADGQNYSGQGMELDPEEEAERLSVLSQLATPVRSHNSRQLFGSPSPAASRVASGTGNSAVAKRAIRGGTATPRRRSRLDSSDDPLSFPSSPGASQRTPRQNISSDDPPTRSERVPLFLRTPTPPPAATPRANRRGDIHPNSSQGPQLLDRFMEVARNQSRNGGATSEADPHFPSSSGPSLSAQPLPPDDPTEARNVIWGTNISIMESFQVFTDFIRNFKPKYRSKYDRERGVDVLFEPSAERGERLLYINYLRKMRLTGQTNLNLDVVNLQSYPPTKKLAIQLQKYPQELIPIMDQVLKDIMIALAEEDAENEAQAAGGHVDEVTLSEINDIAARIYMVRPFGFPAINMRDLNPSDTDKLCCIKGLVIRATPVIPDMKSAFFRCLNCSHTMQVEIDRGRIAEPEKCPRDVCGTVGAMALIHNRSTFADRQVIRLQETPDVVPDGQTPHTVSLCVYDELVDLSKPGDRLIVTGIFRAVPVRVNPRQRTIKALFKTYIDIVHISRGDGKRLGLDQSTRTGENKAPGVGLGVGVGGEEVDDDEFDGNELGIDNPDGEDQDRPTKTAMVEEKIKELSRRDDLYELLSRSLAPSIWEMDDVKKGILLQLFGGTNKSVEKGGGGGGPRYRGDINVLLVGDPGTSKSQILQYVHKIAPRGVFTSGKGASAVGLTAYVTRDPDTKQLVLESGALVLSDGGVCCIDEFDKMSDATRSVLHEVMEQQTVSIAKAGIITTLNARTSILAAANPVQSKYNPNWPIAKNIDLPPTLISRFDLLYLVLDRVDEDNDRKLAQHLVGLYLSDRPEAATQDILPLETLTAYITYARTHIRPVITEEAGNALVSAYVGMRKVGGEDTRSSERRITATTRQLESLIRLAEAHARMRLCDYVELQDVEEADRLMREAIRASATDPVTGLIDIDLLNTGAGQAQRRMRVDLKRAVIRVLDEGSARGVRWADCYKTVNEGSSVNIEAAEFSEVVKALESEGVVKVKGDKERRVIQKVRNE